MKSELSCNVVIHTEEVEGKIVYVAECEELGISDFGDTPEEAIHHLREALRLLISVEPQKAESLRRNQNIMITRLYL